MYSFKINGMDDTGAVDDYGIYDPDGDYLCSVSDVTTAMILVSHLNRS